MSIEQTDLLQVAAQFVNSTASHIFLTGKAGTGKTTLLRNLALQTHKNFVIVAPTGIAALNAQGVTIHSQFLLPLGSFIPERNPTGNFSETAGFYSQHTLARKHPLNSIRKQVLRATDLLIIDEVSMLRADVLDVIDYRMRSVKGNFNRSFGGAQVLMIGDLYQLPPIVKDYEWEVLRHYYNSMHFFEAHALRKEGMVYIELDKIFRQQDEKFIGVLNNLRNNIVTDQDIATLNSHYRGDAPTDDEEVITITTHNYKADAINTKELEALPGAPSIFEAEVQGDFPEKLYPIAEKIALKVGARVMFVKNDSSGEGDYYNGKLALVDEVDDDGVTVTMADTNEPFLLRKEKWENKRYTIDEDSKELEEEVIGTFVQYPVKLAWAVTVHKSQGLTFDKAIIDVGQAFAPGQVYVALSRLRSLEGLILRTKINTSSLSSDSQVVSFTQEKEQQKPLDEMLQEHQREFLDRLLATTFDFSDIEKQIAYLKKGKTSKMEFEDESMQKAMEVLQSRFDDEKKNTITYRNQLLGLLRQNDPEKLLGRIRKGSTYYSGFMEENLRQLLLHVAEVEQFTRTKTYLNALSEIDQLLMKTMGEIDKAGLITDCIISGKEIPKLDEEHENRTKRRVELMTAARQAAEENPKFAKRKSGRKRKKREKGETYTITFGMLKEGMRPEEIASKRSMAVSTIEGHIARGISAGEVRILDLVSEDIVDEVADKLRTLSGGINEVHKALNGKYTYGVLRMVQAHLTVK